MHWESTEMLKPWWVIILKKDQSADTYTAQVY